MTTLKKQCENCIYNNDMGAWPETRLPCGQFNCWHALHAKAWEDLEEDELKEEFSSPYEDALKDFFSE